MYCRIDRRNDYRMTAGWIHGRNSRRRVGKMGERIDGRIDHKMKSRSSSVEESFEIIGRRINIG